MSDARGDEGRPWTPPGAFHSAAPERRILTDAGITTLSLSPISDKGGGFSSTLIFGRDAQIAVVSSGMANGPNVKRTCKSQFASRSWKILAVAPERKQRWLDCLDYFRDGRVAASRWSSA
jgi:hypothetical protein